MPAYPFVAAILCAVASAAAGPARAPERPNLLFIITDDQRFDMMGNLTPMLHTPEMDRLAREGAHFQRAFVTTAICAASRASLLTGLVERSHHYTFKTPPLAPRFVDASLPKRLRDAGYATGYVGKLGVNLPRGASDALYDRFDPKDRPYWKKQPDGSVKHLTDIEGELAMSFLDEHARTHARDGKPFFLTVGFNAPHADDEEPLQYMWQKEVDHLYRDLNVPKPPLSDPKFYDALPEYLRDGTMNRHRWYWRFDFESKRQTMTKGYFRMLSGVDLVIGRIRRKLSALGYDRNTVILLIGDNGYFLGERGYADKWLPYDPSVHVPLVLYDPSGRNARPGTRPTAFALNIDVPATLLEIAGVRAPAMQGRSLIPPARGTTPADWRHDFWIEHLMEEPSIRKHEGVRNERFRYSRYFEATPLLEELYDLQADPLETKNLVSSPTHRSTLEAMRRRTDELRAQYSRTP